MMDNKKNPVKLPISELQAGMYVTSLDRPWDETPFFEDGFKIHQRSDIAKLRQYCDHVYVLNKGFSLKTHGQTILSRVLTVLPGIVREPMAAQSGTGNKDAAISSRAQPANAVITDAREELVRARAIYERGKFKLARLLYTAKNNGVVDIRIAEKIVAECVESILRNPDALIWMSKIKNAQDYEIEHRLNISILAMVFGHYQNFSREKLCGIGLSGLLSQVGNVNTTPYPRIIPIVDTYDAMTSDRPYAQVKCPVEAQKVIYENRGKQFDEQCVLTFMQAFGGYPAGTWVELHNGMLGVVLKTQAKFRYLPIVILIANSDKQSVEQVTIDLSLTESGGLDRCFLIKKALHDGSFGFYLKDLPIAGDDTSEA